MKKIIVTAIGLVLSLSSFAGLPKLLYPSEKEATAMLNEADDFIDDLPDGYQDREADAVYHAMKGVGGELASIRLNSIGDYSLSAKVDHKDIVGEGSARGLKMRLYTPKNKGKNTLPLLVYMHGSGWVSGGVGSSARFCDAVAEGGKVAVLEVDFALAPEHPFPEGLNDCLGAIEFAISKSKEWGSSPELVSVGGDSTGANLALAAAIDPMFSKTSGKGLRSVVLIYPVLKAYKDSSASWKEYSRGYGLDGRLMEAYNEAYLNGSNARGEASENPSASPFHATDAQLKQLPPVLIISASRDILFDQGKMFTERLVKLGNDAEQIVLPGAVHRFVTEKGQPTAFNRAVILTDTFLAK